MREEDSRLKELETKLDNFQQANGLKESLNKNMLRTNSAVNILAELFAAIIVGLGLGWFIDSKLNTKPWAIIICMILSFLACIRRLTN